MMWTMTDVNLSDSEVKQVKHSEIELKDEQKKQVKLWLVRQQYFRLQQLTVSQILTSCTW